MYDKSQRDMMHQFLQEQMAASDRTDMQLRPPDLAGVGASMGLSTAEAAALFQSMKGVYWWGNLHEVDELPGWVLAVVDRVA